MLKRKLTEYSGIAAVCLGCVLFLLDIYWLAAIVLALWYALYGFVGLAFWFSGFRNVGISNILLRMTFYPTLVPFRKAFYFWIKTMNIILKNPSDTEKALSFALQVNIDALATSNNKAYFLSTLAALYNDMGDKENALDAINRAKEMPCKAITGEQVNRVYDIIMTD